MKLVSFAVVTGLSALALFGDPVVAESKTSVSTSPTGLQGVVVRDVTRQGDVVSGVVVNQSSRKVRDVQLLIRNAWLWNNERHPGTNNPARASFYAAPITLPPGGSAPFTYQLAAPLPARSDGRFNTQVEVVGFTEVGGSQDAVR